MKTPLRTLTCALAAASVLAAVPAGANPGPQRVTGGPGASALLKSGVLTMHWRGGSARIQVPPDYLLPAVTTRGELGGLSFDGRRPSSLLAARRGRALPLPGSRERQTDAADLPRHGDVRRHRTARQGDLPDQALVGHGRHEVHRAPVQPRRQGAQSGRDEDRVLGRGPGEARGVEMQGQPLTARPPPTAAGRTRSTTPASTRSSTRCRSGRAAGRPASSCRSPGALRRRRCACARRQGTRSRC